MNLKTQITPSLWEAIESNYQAEQYKNAILDSVYFISDVIREKTGLDSDGTALVSGAFGKNSPKLKMNNLKTESERNIQEGMQHLLRGVYQNIRNPRSHGKYHDKKEDADAIIFFINYLVNQINKSKTAFDLIEFVDRVIDPEFVESQKYVNALIKEIPKNKKLEVLLRIYSRRNEQENNKLYLINKKLLNQIDAEEKDIVYSTVSDDLKTTCEIFDIRKIIAIFPTDNWQFYEEAAKIRIENMLLNSVKEGAYDITNGSLFDGHFGTWASGIIEHSESKVDFYESLLSMISSSDSYKQDYVMEYFVGQFSEADEFHFKQAKDVFIEAFSRGDKRFHDVYVKRLQYHSRWKAALADACKNFKQQEIDLKTQKPLYGDFFFDEDIPF